MILTLVLTHTLAMPLGGMESFAYQEADSLEIRAWTANDGLASLRDLARRSDEGPTATVGLSFSTLRGEQLLDGQVRYAIFTDFEGPKRTEWLVLRTALGEQRSLTNVSLTYKLGVGVQVTGNLLGARIQNALHAMTPTERDLTFDTGLQRDYTRGLSLAPEINAEVSLRKRFGLFSLDVGIDGQLPVGAIGLAWIGATLGTRVGKEVGFYGTVGLRGGLQRGFGGVFDFNGAPTNGLVAMPSAGFGYSWRRWLFGFRWERNHLGVDNGFGDSINIEVGQLVLATRFAG